MKKIKDILNEIMDISRIPMVLYDTDGKCVAASSADPDPSSLADNVLEFVHSNVEIGRAHV